VHAARRPPLRLLRLANPFVRLVLRSPAHRLLSSGLMLVAYTGRRSGRSVEIPVMYAPVAGAMVALAADREQKLWWRVFRAGAPATLTVRRERIDATGRVLAGDEARDALRHYLARFPRAAARIGANEGSPAAELDAAADHVALVRFESRR
jgi:hypothetical protein